jgi:hypothetical protein
MAISFNITRHSVFQNIPIVEVLIDGKVSGVIYPAGEKRIKIISAHIVETKKEEGFSGETRDVSKEGGGPEIPAFMVTFSRSPYTIIGNKVVKK